LPVRGTAATPRREDPFSRSWVEVEQQVGAQVVLHSAPQPVDVARVLLGDPPLVVAVVTTDTLGTSLVDLPTPPVVSEPNESGRPLGRTVVESGQERRVIGLPRAVPVIDEQVHLHRDLPAAKLTGELAIDVGASHFPVKVVPVLDLELLGQVNFD